MNRKGYILLGSGFGLICLWFFILFIPFQTSNNKYEHEIQQAQNQFNDFNQTISMLPSIIKRKGTLERQKFELNSRLYTKAEVLSLFEKLKEKAAFINLSVSEITPPVEELLLLNSIIPDSTKPQFLNIGMRLKGNYIQFGKFVEILEREDYFRGINRCIITGDVKQNIETNFYIGFKALLGRYEAKI